MITLTQEQDEVREAARTFLRRYGGRRYFTYHGLAGTGKTVVLAQLARELPSAVPCTFTGKAASVLRERTGLPVITVHSFLYNYGGTYEDENGKHQPVFTSKGENHARTTVLLDECSTIGTRLAEDILATGARVIACGDPGQLPPVADRQFFIDANVELTTVHRQALESAVIRQAHAVRSAGRYRNDGPDFRVTERASEDDLATCGIALCWKNRTRRLLNGACRRARGIENDTGLLAGEPVMCLRNDHARRIYNGAIYPLAVDWVPGDELLVRDGDREVNVFTPTIEGFSPDFETERNDDGCVPFALAYAATVHKSQGSEWQKVLFVDEQDPRNPEWPQFAYTAITRASQQVAVVRR